MTDDKKVETIDEDTQENMKRFAEVFQELNASKKAINEDIKATRESFVMNGELSKAQIKQVERAIKMIKTKVDLEELVEIAMTIEERVEVDQ